MLPAKNTVDTLHELPEACALRQRQVKQWHAHQALGENVGVCLLHLAITADRRIASHALGIEPEHALVLIEALDEMRKTLVEFACNRPDSITRAATVIPLRTPPPPTQSRERQRPCVTSVGAHAP